MESSTSVDHGRAVDRTVRHGVALEGHPPNHFVCVKIIPEYHVTFFCWESSSRYNISIYLNLPSVRAYLDLEVLIAP